MWYGICNQLERSEIFIRNYLNGFPTAKESARKTIQGGLSKTIKAIESATILGRSKITIYDKKEIELIFQMHDNLEIMGYELNYDFPEELDWHLDEVIADDIKSATLSWDKHIYKS